MIAWMNGMVQHDDKCQMDNHLNKLSGQNPDTPVEYTHKKRCLYLLYTTLIVLFWRVLILAIFSYLGKTLKFIHAKINYCWDKVIKMGDFLKTLKLVPAKYW